MGQAGAGGNTDDPRPLSGAAQFRGGVNDDHSRILPLIVGRPSSEGQ